MQSVIAEKNTKIVALETEISSMRANCRTSKDLLNSKCESICDDMEKISAIAKSISSFSQFILPVSSFSHFVLPYAIKSAISN